MVNELRANQVNKYKFWVNIIYKFKWTKALGNGHVYEQN